MQTWNADTIYSKKSLAGYGNAIFRSLKNENTDNTPVGGENDEWWEAYTNPLMLVYDALWTLLEARQEFCDLVPVGNRIKYSGANLLPDKEQICTADLPEVRIIGTGGSTQIISSSSATKFTQNISIGIATGDHRLDALLFPVEWEILCALAKFRETLFALKWADKTFVTIARLTSQGEGINARDENRGIQGWSAIWACEIEMMFSTNDLKTFPIIEEEQP